MCNPLTHHQTMSPRRSQRLTFIKDLKNVKDKTRALDSPLRMTVGEFTMKWDFWFSGNDGVLEQ